MFLAYEGQIHFDFKQAGGQPQTTFVTAYLFSKCFSLFIANPLCTVNKYFFDNVLSFQNLATLTCYTLK